MIGVEIILTNLVRENSIVHIFTLLDCRPRKRRLLALEKFIKQELEWVRVFYAIRRATKNESHLVKISMSQIASFYLIKDGHRVELSNANCSGAVYMAIWDWCESELDLDVRSTVPQTDETLDCALLQGELASKLLGALRRLNLPELSTQIATNWDLPSEAVQSGLEALKSHLELVRDNAIILYEMT